MKKGISKGRQMFKNEGGIIKKSYQESFDEYIVKANIRGLSKETINTYNHQHKYFTQFLGDIKNCSDITLFSASYRLLHHRGHGRNIGRFVATLFQRLSAMLN